MGADDAATASSARSARCAPPDAPTASTSGLPAGSLATRAEDRFNRLTVRLLRRRGWRPVLVTYPSYGTRDWVRLRGRVLMAPPSGIAPGTVPGRGWRTFVSAEVPAIPVDIATPIGHIRALTDRTGHLDMWLPIRLTPGWHELAARPATGRTSLLPVRVIGPDTRLGVICDLDDTVVVTSVPTLLLAAWNFLITPEHKRRPVPGMAELFARIERSYPGAPVFYLSNGAWNSAPAVRRFLRLHGFPRGPLELSDFGPSQTGLIRPARDHKALAMAQLAAEFPHLNWLLIGDDGQRDPLIYRQFAADHPGRVAAVAIRQLTRRQQAQINGVPAPTMTSRWAVRRLDASRIPLATGRDGLELQRSLRNQGLLSATGPDPAEPDRSRTRR